MMRFIELTDKSGRKLLVNLNAVRCIIDHNKTIGICMGDETITVSLSYSAFLSWLITEPAKPILHAGNIIQG